MVCECDNELVPGVLFPWNSDAGIAGVECCDQCQRFESDYEASEALLKVLGDEFYADDYTVPGHSRGHAYRAIFWKKTDMVLSYDAGLMLREMMAYRRAAEALTSTILATGGIKYNVKSCLVPVGDTKWADLADAYILACKALDCEPLINAAEDGPDDDEQLFGRR